MNKFAWAVFSLGFALPAAAITIIDGGGCHSSPAPSIVQVAQSFAQLGTERLSRLGSPVLADLSALLMADKVGDGAVFQRLADQLGTRVGAEQFAAMDAEQKAEALKIAGLQARMVLDARVNGLLRKVPERWSAQAVAEQEKDLSEVIVDQIYLSPERREKIQSAVASIAAFKQARKDAFEAWLRDTPAKIANGAFDHGGIIVKGEDGWRIAEHSPNEQAYPTYAAAFAARKAEILSMPEGPWQRSAAEELIASAAEPEIALQAREEGADIEGLSRQAGGLKGLAATFAGRAEDGKANAVLGKFMEYPGKARVEKPRRRDAIVLLRHYDSLLTDHRISQRTLETHWRIQAALLKGDLQSGYRPYDELMAARPGQRDYFFHGIGASFAGAVGMIAFVAAHQLFLAVVFLVVSVGGMLLAFRPGDEGLLGDRPGDKAGHALRPARAAFGLVRGAVSD